MLPEIKSILVAVSLADDTSLLLDYALSLAEKYSARIHLVHGHELPDLSAQYMAEVYMFQEEFAHNYDLARDETEKHLRNRLERFCHQHLEKSSASAEVFGEKRVVHKPAKDAILDTAEELGVDLILIGSHRNSLLTDALLGSTTMKVLHSANIPVLVVRIPA